MISLHHRKLPPRFCSGIIDGRGAGTLPWPRFPRCTPQRAANDGRRFGTADQVALRMGAPQALQQRELFRGFDSLGHAIQFQHPADLQDRLDQGARPVVLQDRLGERAVDLDVGEREPAQGLELENPVPKSSSASRTPSSRRANRVTSICRVSSSSWPSVTSSTRRDGGSPVLASIPRTSSTISPRRSWAGATLTETLIGLAQLSASRQAVSITQRPSSMIRPVRSASGMKLAGGMIPCTGWCQRTSASAPTIRSARMSRIG